MNTEKEEEGEEKREGLDEEKEKGGRVREGMDGDRREKGEGLDRKKEEEEGCLSWPYSAFIFTFIFPL